jgi:hypothetical protein
MNHGATVCTPRRQPKYDEICLKRFTGKRLQLQNKEH